MSAVAQSNRTRELARIHCLRRDLRLNEETYRDMLWTVARVRSAAKLDVGGRQRVIEHMAERAGAASNTRRRRQSSSEMFLVPRIRIPVERRAMAVKICVLLTDRGRGHAYADAIARRMLKVDRWEFATAIGLHKLVAALEYDRNRNERRKA